MVLHIEGGNDVLRLEVVWDGRQPPDIGDYVHITTDVRHRGTTNWATIAVMGRHFFADAYPLLRSVADLVQLDGATFADAVDRALTSYHDLLAAQMHMSARDEVGLYGELLVLAHLVRSLGADEALASWRGGDEHEEHDLGLAADDVEIKTTTADARRHWIGSLTQLQPSLSRPLWLVSIQLTGAGAAAGSERLPDLIARIESGLPNAQAANFRRRLARTTYRASQPESTFRLLRLRSAPACFRVDSDFPRLNGQILADGGADTQRIHELSYTIHLDGLSPAAEPPTALVGLDNKDKDTK